jgi:hypothetical protein
MLRGIILDRVDSITDLRVVMDIFYDVTARKLLTILEFVKKLSCEFRDPSTRRTFNVSYVRPKLEYASCVWWPFYDVYINRIARVQREFVARTGMDGHV